LTAGTNITITNTAGGITIASTGGGGTPNFGGIGGNGTANLGGGGGACYGATYGGGQVGPTVDANPLSTMAELQQINTSQQALKKAKATYGPDVQAAQANAQKAQTEADKANIQLGNEKMGTMYSILTPYGSDERIVAAGKIDQNTTPDQLKSIQNGLYDIGDEVKQGLISRGWSKADAMQYVHDFNDIILKDPRQAPNLITRATQSLAGALNIAEQNQPQYEKNAAGQIIGIKKAQQKISPIGDNSGTVNPTSGGVTSTNKYIEDLNTRNSTALETDMRLGEAKDLLKLVKGGAGTKNFSEIARWAQAANLPTEIVDSIAGGDLSAVQSAQKFITQAVIQGATSNPGTAESINRYIKDNPDIGTDPRALERFIKFTEKLNQKTFDETEFLLNQKKNGKFNPETHVQEVQQYLRKNYLKPEVKSPENKPSEGKQSARKIVREGVDKVTGRAVVQYDDGTTGYK
jgi:outer membrane murein-binding lipoprotein Lpp